MNELFISAVAFFPFVICLDNFHLPVYIVACIFLCSLTRWFWPQAFNEEEAGAGHLPGGRSVRLLWSCFHQCQASESSVSLSNASYVTPYYCVWGATDLSWHVCLLQGFCLDWCKKPDVGLPKPDLVMFLNLSPAEAALRGQFGEERYETSVFQRAVQQKFEQLMKDPSVNWQVRDKSGL